LWKKDLEARYNINRTLQGKSNSPLQGWLDLKELVLKAPAREAGTILFLFWLGAFQR
jgi:hypothetical protein